MSFPSRFPGRCSRCAGAIRKGELIEYDSATKKAWHPDCPEQTAIPMEGREPGEKAAAAPEPTTPRRTGTRKQPASADEAWARTVEHGRADVVICYRCGGSSKDGRPMLHVACIDADDSVPF